MFVPIEVIWKGLWVNYQPQKNGNLQKSAVLKDILEFGKQTIKDGFARRIACIFISKALPLLFPNAQELENNQYYQLEKIPEENKEERMNTIPEIPINLREQLKREVRDEILGRKSAQDLVDLGRKARDNASNKRTVTSPDLREAIKRQKTDATGTFEDKTPSNSPLTTTISIPTIPAVSLKTQSFHVRSTSPPAESGDINNSNNNSNNNNKTKNSTDISTNNNLSSLQRTLSTPPLNNNSSEIISVFSAQRKPAIPSSPPTDGRVLREVQALRSIIAGMQKEIDLLKDAIEKRDKKERNLNSDIIKMKAEISILSATLNSASAIQQSNLGSNLLPVLPSTSTFKINHDEDTSEEESQNQDTTKKESRRVAKKKNSNGDTVESSASVAVSQESMQVGL